MTLITSPAKEKGQTFLKRKTEMWHYMPNIGRMVKLPPSMMTDGWMGSDYTNDDILKESSMLHDFSHRIIGEEKVDNLECYKIEMIAREDAAIVWGKIIKWISKKDYLILQSEFYDEDGYIVKTEYGKEIEKMDGRTIPTKIEIVPADKKNQKTVVKINNIKFNMPLEEPFFSQQNMQRVR